MLPLNTEAPNFSLTNGVDQIQVTFDKIKEHLVPTYV